MLTPLTNGNRMRVKGIEEVEGGGVHTSWMTLEAKHNEKIKKRMNLGNHS